MNNHRRRQFHWDVDKHKEHLRRVMICILIGVVSAAFGVVFHAEICMEFSKASLAAVVYFVFFGVLEA